MYHSIVDVDGNWQAERDGEGDVCHMPFLLRRRQKPKRSESVIFPVHNSKTRACFCVRNT